MVKKLFKHEILAWCRILPIVYIIFLCIATMGRIIQFFEADALAYDIMITSATIVYIIGIIACFAFPTVFGIVRFYKNLFSGEGYLSFTLPVTVANHIWVKLLTAFMFDIISFIVVFLSAVIMTSGDLLNEIIKAISYLCGNIPENLATELPIFIIEFVIAMLASSLYRYLLFYACITVGQLFNKNRVLAAVGVYFGYYMVSQIIGTILGVVFSIVSVSIDTDAFVMSSTADAFSYFNGIMIIGIIFNCLVSAVLFFLTHYIMRKRLNLE